MNVIGWLRRLMGKNVATGQTHVTVWVGEGPPWLDSEIKTELVCEHYEAK